MAEYILEKGAKPSKDTIRVEDYLVGTLYTTIPKQGYIEKKECIDKKRGDDRSFISNYKGPGKVEEAGLIIIKNTPLLKTKILPVKATEFLTGTKFDLLSFRWGFFDMYNCTSISNKELDTFVHLHHSKHPTIEELWNYIQKHKDVEVYKNELELLKEKGIAYHQRKKIQEMQEAQRIKEETLSIRRIS